MNHIYLGARLCLDPRIDYFCPKSSILTPISVKIVDNVWAQQFGSNAFLTGPGGYRRVGKKLGNNSVEFLGPITVVTPPRSKI